MWTTGRFILNNRALRPASSLEVGTMFSFSFQSALQRQINFLRFLDSLPAPLRCLWNSSILLNKFSFEEHVLILKCFSWLNGFSPGGGGGIPGNTWRGCAARFSKFSYHGFISYSIGTSCQICSYTTVGPSKTIPDSRPKWAKSIPVFRPNRLKIHTLWGGTYWYHGLYKGVYNPLKKKV